MGSSNICHQVISASAGSGKTFQLVNRYLQLILNHNVNLEKIIALTFSRKAAAEIFDDIIQRLATSAVNDEKRIELTNQIQNKNIERHHLISLLRELIQRLHKVRISTYDSFFAWIVKSFPLEFGISGDFEILEPDQVQLENQRLIANLIKNPAIDSSLHSTFFKAFKQATFGKNEKRIAALLQEFIMPFHTYYLDVPEHKYWGNPEEIWPRGSHWLEEKTNLKRDTATLKELIGQEDLTVQQLERWDVFLVETAKFCKDSPLSKNLEYLLKKLITCLNDLDNGSAEITIARKKQILGKEVCNSILHIIRGIIRQIIDGQLDKTRGIYKILDLYERQYHQNIRQSGRLSFSDIETLLAVNPENNQPLQLSQNPCDRNRLYIDYRLDSQFDHWLLDEFQDT